MNKETLKKINESIEIGTYLDEIKTLSLSDRLDFESSPDGQNVLIEVTPSTKDDITRWAMSMEKRFKLSPKQARLLGYSVKVTINSTLSLEIRREVEKQLQFEGFEATFNYYRSLALEMLKLESPNEVRSFKESSSEWIVRPLSDEDENEEKGPMEVYEEAYASYEEEHWNLYPTYQQLHEDAENYAFSVVESVYGKYGTRWFRELHKKQMMESLLNKIKRAGKNRIGEIGKKLYEFSKSQKTFSREEMTLLFEAHKRRKKQLREWEEKEREADFQSLLNSL